MGVVFGAVFGVLAANLQINQSLSIDILAQCASYGVWSLVCGLFRGHAVKGDTACTAAILGGIILVGAKALSPVKSERDALALDSVKMALIGIGLYVTIEVLVLPKSARDDVRAAHRTAMGSVFSVVGITMSPLQNLDKRQVDTNAADINNDADNDAEDSASRFAYLSALLESPGFVPQRPKLESLDEDEFSSFSLGDIAAEPIREFSQSRVSETRAGTEQEQKNMSTMRIALSRGNSGRFSEATGVSSRQSTIPRSASRKSSVSRTTSVARHAFALPPPPAFQRGLDSLGLNGDSLRGATDSIVEAAEMVVSR